MCQHENYFEFCVFFSYFRKIISEPFGPNGTLQIIESGPLAVAVEVSLVHTGEIILVIIIIIIVVVVVVVSCGSGSHICKLNHNHKYKTNTSFSIA